MVHWPSSGGAFAALVRLYRADGSVDRIVSRGFQVMPSPPEGWTEPGFDASAWAAPVPSGANVHNDPRPSEPAIASAGTIRKKRPIWPAIISRKNNRWKSSTMTC